MQQKLLEFESQLVKSSTTSGHQQQETLHLLKAEFKWLERQKKKLKNDRKQLKILQEHIQGKQQLLNEFSAVLV
jgi:dihydroorotase